MKTLVLFSSPHKNGNTAQLLDSYVSGCAADVITVNLYETPPLPCMDCGKCKNSFCCSLSDLDSVMQIFMHCDRVIFAFPVYNLSLPAPLKAFFDRCQRFYNARFSLEMRPPIEKKRVCVLLITCGGKYEKVEQTLMAQLQPAFTVLNFGEIEVVVRDETDTGRGKWKKV